MMRDDRGAQQGTDTQRRDPKLVVEMTCCFLMGIGTVETESALIYRVVSELLTILRFIISAPSS